jgi:hypothetical protein
MESNRAIETTDTMHSTNQKRGQDLDPKWQRKANTFAGHLEKTFKPNELPQNEDLETEINKALTEPL